MKAQRNVPRPDCVPDAAKKHLHNKNTISLDCDSGKNFSQNFQKIPDEIKQLNQWVVYRLSVDKKKVPFNAKTKKKAKTNDPATWSSYQQALDTFNSGGFDSIGFVFTKNDPFIGIDLDKCRNQETGEIEPEMRKVIEAVNSYTEVSQSGSGVHIICKGSLPSGGNKKGKVEIYNSGRYFVMTGNHLTGTPIKIESRTDQIKAVHNKIFGKEKNNIIRKSQTKSSQSHTGTTLPENFETILENNPQFRVTWERKRTDFPDQSASAYEMSIANFGARQGWTRDEIASCFYHWRKKHGENTSKAHRPDYVTRTIEKASENSIIKAESLVLPLGQYRIEAVSPRKTNSGKINLQARIKKENVTLDLIGLTSAISNREKAVKHISNIINGEIGQKEIEGIIGKLLLLSASRIDEKKKRLSNLPTIKEVLNNLVPEIFQLKYRTEKGAWSEAWKREVKRGEFITHTTESLISSCEFTRDAPINPSGEVNRSRLTKSLESELKILWATIIDNLPEADKSNLTSESVAAKRFRNGVIKVWTKTNTLERTTNVKTGDTRTGERPKSRRRTCFFYCSIDI